MFDDPSTDVAIKTALLAGGLYFVVWPVLNYLVIDPWRSPLRNLPGPRPKGNGPFMSNLEALMNPSISPKAHDQYIKTFGKTFRVFGFGYFDQRVLTLDPRAMNHILNNNQIYEKPWQSRRLVSNLIGNGLLSSEGIHHKKQRKVMNPAFSLSNMRAYTPIFLQKAHQLRRRWLGLITGPEPAETLDLVHWISRATFDVIGLTGFDYVFNAIENEDNDVYLAYKDMFDLSINQGQNLRALMGIWYPWLDTIWPTAATRVVKKSHEIIYGVGNQLVQETKRQILEGKLDEKNSKSMLSLLIKSNLSNTNPEQRITDEDIMDQINTFFFAGSDTTSLALAWTFLLLCEKPQYQTRLREEILAVYTPPEGDEEPDYALDFNVIDNLPFLDKVTKESLRLIPPVHSSIRVALQDDVIPTKYPVKLADGTETHGVKIGKGQFVHVPMEGFNLDKTVWGDDAWEFRPERWDNLPELVKEQPGLWQNILTFSSGPRSCIGQKFSIIEMKTFLFVLLAAFTFEASSDVKFWKINLVLTRPYVAGQRAKGSQLPLR
ncbi:hypothetical protein FRC01_007948, partial [Tulasnella sp. 417]